MYIPINFLGTKLSADTLTTVDYLIVAGGGGGGSTGAGGGAGGLISGSINVINFPNAELTASVVVGISGSGGNGVASTSKGGNGGNSYIYITSSIVATGGGGGGSAFNGYESGLNGGSGGGACIPPGNPADTCLGTPGQGTSGQGYRGGYGWRKSGTNSTGSGGGGGASEVGQCGYNTLEIAGRGGSGSQWLDGEWYAGGGGAVATTFGLSGGSGGIGGGGFGNPTGTGATGSSATGGGGGAGWVNGGAGGSGIVIFRYYGTEIRGYGGDVETIGNYTYHKFREITTASFEFSAYSQNNPNPLDYCNGIKFLAGPDGGTASYRLCNATASVTQSLSGSEYILKCVDTSYSYSVSGVNSEVIYMDGCGEYKCNYVTFTAGGSGGSATYVRCGSNTGVTQSLSANQTLSTCVEYGAPIGITGVDSQITYSGSCFF